MLSLGIESTAHTIGIGIVDGMGKILADQKAVFKPPEGWGIKPADAANHHRLHADSIVKNALTEAKTEMSEIDIISVAAGPGMPPCLSVGFNLAKETAKKYSKPLAGVNHCIAHIEIAKLLAKAKDPTVVFVSGANTQIIGYMEGRYRILGETQDIGLGNALDKFGRFAGIGFPAGPAIEELAKRGEYMELPYTVKGMDLAFSGLITHTSRLLEKGKKLEDICFSLQETAFAMVTEVAERAMAHAEKDELVVTGGVAANQRLCQMLDIMCRERGGKFFACPKKYSGDNGVMIAWLGLLSYKSGNNGPQEINPRWRVDEVDAEWAKG